MYSDSPRLRGSKPRAAIKQGLTSVRYALRHNSLLEKHTSVLVGVSGGIDSLVLLFLLIAYRDTFKQHWTIKAAHIDMGFPDWNPPDLQECLSQRNIHYVVAKADIYHRLLNTQDKCFLCSRGRREKLMKIAEKCNTFNIALAHHQEDVAETLLLNMLHTGRISTLLPKQAVVHGRFFVVRPLYYLDKRTILKIGQAFGLKNFGNSCPFYRDSRRESVRNMLNKIKKKNPDIYNNVFHSIFNIKKPYMPL